MENYEIDTYDSDDGTSVTELIITLEDTEFVVEIPSDNPQNPELYEREVGSLSPETYHTSEIDNINDVPVADES